jgi:hypothetical protein
MSYTASTPGSKPVPGAVRAAQWLLYLCAAIELLSLIPGFVVVGAVRQAVQEEFAGDPAADAATTAATIGIIFGVTLAVIISVAAIVLGVLLGRGKQPARIVTWVVAGLGVLCMGCSLGGNALSSSLNNMAGADANATAIQDAILEATPGWATAFQTLSTIVVLLALIAVIILLALPASNEFFRKEEEVWVPPTYPGQPAFPPSGPPSVPPMTPPAAGPPSYPPPPAQGDNPPPPPPAQ